MSTMQVPDEKKPFFNSLHTLYGHVVAKDNLSRLRAKAWNRLLEVGLPDRKNPTFRPLRLRSLYSKELTAGNPSDPKEPLYSSHLLEEAKVRLVFINGQFSKKHSKVEDLPKKVVLTTIQDAMATYAPLLNEKGQASLEREENPFALINMACHLNGLFLYVPPKTIIEEPIELVHVVDTVGSPLLMPRLCLFLGKMADVKVEARTLYIGGEQSITTKLIEVHLEEGARAHVTEVVDNAPDESMQYHSIRAYLQRDSQFKAVSITNGSKTVHQDFRAELLGENSEAHLSGLSILRGSREAHTHVTMDHRAPNTRSMQLFKSVLHDRSHSSFDGKIVVAKEAQKTEAYQLNNNLVLSPDAKAETRPNLKIFADDVKASHGATVGQLDEDQLFYLLTRGFDRVKAKELLIKGFCQELIDLIPYASLKRIALYWE